LFDGDGFTHALRGERLEALMRSVSTMQFDDEKRFWYILDIVSYRSTDETDAFHGEAIILFVSMEMKFNSMSSEVHMQYLQATT
jgi:hypothetical protein